MYVTSVNNINFIVDNGMCSLTTLYTHITSHSISHFASNEKIVIIREIYIAHD